MSFRYTGDQLWAALGQPEGWSDPGLSVKVYIDDINNIEKVCHSNAVTYISAERRKSWHMLNTVKIILKQ